MPSSSSDLIFRWVPGTLDRVRVEGASAAYEATADAVIRALGRVAVQNLYLTGRHVHRLPTADLDALLARLGCTPVLSMPPAPTGPSLPVVQNRGGFD